ncbi:helix-turn-helix domain-containing protein [Streptomyces beigongshangae]|uniref:helix-turn-helix domain-containing protein n=1 Tax=Streptomyces beigongshangae TaxID=2841597 RepID=UPI001C84C15A|nr:helix-turn-helix transcriptional regulator [Streptomyces sp. REN17]
MVIRDGRRPAGRGDDEHGGTVSTRDDDVEGFAALLRRLKARTDRSYGALARRADMNTSTLHRYCAGDAVPVDFAPVERFARLCGATPAERLELHRLWILAVAARQRPRTPAGRRDEPEPVPVPQPEPVPEPECGPGAGAGDASAVRTSGTSRPHPHPRPWSTPSRRRIAVAVAALAALFATLGGLSALPADGPADGASETAGPSSPVPAVAPGARQRPSADSSADGTSPSPPAGDATGRASESPGGGSGGVPPVPSKEARDSGNPQDARDTGPDGGGPGAVPLTWTANSQVWQSGCDHDYVIRKDPRQVPPPPAPQDAGAWAATQAAVHGRQTDVEISVQGRTSRAVVLTALRVRVVGRTAPVPGNVYAMDQGCGGAVTPRSFAVDLDRNRPIARSVPGNDTGTPIPAVRMPYRVSAEDPEVLLVTARTKTCACSWYLELDWSSEGRTGTVRIDDRGRPFRTSGIEGLPRYWYAPDGSDGARRRWVPAG